MKRLIFSLLLAIFFIVNAIPPARAQETNVPRFESIDCPFGIPFNEKIRCGFLIVPENRSIASSPTIKIGVAIISSHATHPAPDPIFFLNGGPGGSLLTFMPDKLDVFAPYLATRDVVLFDQRGSGWSRPALNCLETEPLSLAQAMGQIPQLEETLAAYRACSDRLTHSGIDLTAYNSVENAADVEDLRRVLGTDQINLFGVSYGTLLGQVIVRDYPQHIRSAILDSAYPLWVSINGDSASGVKKFFNLIFDNCNAQVICRTLYPDLLQVLDELIDRYTRTPVTLSAVNPIDDQPYTFTFDQIALMRWLIYTPPAQLPALLYDLRNGDYDSVLRTQSREIQDLVRPHIGVSVGMKTSMLCRLSLIYVSPEQLAQSTAQYPASAYINLSTATDMAVCAQWPAHAIDPRDQVLFNTDVPLLVVGGEYDLGSPSSYATAIADRSTHGYAFTMPDVGHGVLVNTNGCATGIALAFINKPDQSPDTSCLKSIAPTEFVVRSAVTRWPVGVLSMALATVLIATIRRGAIGLRKNDRMWTWPISLRLIGLWLPLASAIVIAIIFIAKPVQFAPFETARVIETIVPLLAGIHAAILFSPEDESALEITLASPRPLAWTILERVSLALLLHGGVALAGTFFAISLTHESLIVAIARWLAPLLICMGLGVCLTLIFRQMVMSIGLNILLWFGLLMASETLVNTWPYLWPIGLYLQPDRSDFALNRVWLILIGLGLIALASTNLIRDHERLLIGKSKSERRRGEA
jgi:pimeloyl-ACP methyl ester carboxylesterase